MRPKLGIKMLLGILIFDRGNLNSHGATEKSSDKCVQNQSQLHTINCQYQGLVSTDQT